MTKKLLCFLLLSLSLAGCSLSTTTEAEVDPSLLDQLTALKREVVALNDKVSELEVELSGRVELIENLEQETHFLKNQQDALYNMSRMNEILVENLPNIVRKQGFIKEIEMDNGTYFVIDEAEWVPVESAPNGGELVNKTDEEVRIEVHSSLSNEVSIFLLKDSALVYQPFDDFKNSQYKGFYNFFIIEEKIVLVKEQLLP
ncbi:hypothetical protein [Bacillus pinisoli]|uniref:hypothetical protein n=1 Tax=Bacillus pinisoli TaxID=2901866 RepID=UPI001FF6B6E2|nr:hypothetical protein [Bacillus pinisoli]